MIFVIKLAVYFLLWTLYSFIIHVLAHIRSKKNFLHIIHMPHHRYQYSDAKWPPLSDYFFWFGGWKESLDVWITFTLPLVILAIFDPVYGFILLAFHYIYEVFLSRNILDHNPNITGKITRFIPIGKYHLEHHKYYKCNYSFYTTLWDVIFRTSDTYVKRPVRAKQSNVAGLPTQMNAKRLNNGQVGAEVAQPVQATANDTRETSETGNLTVENVLAQ